MSDDATREMTLRVLPYEDGSGFKVTVKATTNGTFGEPELRVAAVNDDARFPASGWPAVRAALDEAYAFLTKESE